jgi:hypothetical protein
LIDSEKTFVDSPLRDPLDIQKMLCCDVVGGNILTPRSTSKGERWIDPIIYATSTSMGGGHVDHDPTRIHHKSELLDLSIIIGEQTRSMTHSLVKVQVNTQIDTALEIIRNVEC